MTESKIRKPAACVLSCALLAGSLIALSTVTTFAQSAVELPAALAQPGTTVQNFFNHDPRPGQFNRDIGMICEGPAIDSAGNLFFTELGNGALSIIWKVSPAGIGSAFLTPANGSSGLEFDNQWRLYAAQNGRLVRYNPDASRDTLAEGAWLANLNDLSIASTGHVVATNLSKLFLFGPGGALIDSVSMSGGPNGVVIVEEKGLVYVTLANGNKVVKFNWSPANPGDFRQAALARTDFVKQTSALPDGITLDSVGNVYVVSNATGTVIVYSPAGDSIGRITVRGRQQFNATNASFGGPGNRTLYIAGAQGAYKVSLKVPGRLRPGIATSLRTEMSARRGAPLRAFDPAHGPLLLALPGYGAGWGVGVYDMRQRKLWETVPANAPRVSWNGTDATGRALPPGLYYIGVFRGSQSVMSQRVLLIRD